MTDTDLDREYATAMADSARLTAEANTLREDVAERRDGLIDAWSRYTEPGTPSDLQTAYELIALMGRDLAVVRDDHRATRLDLAALTRNQHANTLNVQRLVAWLSERLDVPAEERDRWGLGIPESFDLTGDE